MRKIPIAACIVLFVGAVSCTAAEGDALAILANIQARHLPYGSILDPIFALTDSDQISGYTRCGDSALWTGHYLAAEAFRYRVTQASDALTNIQAAVSGLKGLADITGTNLLARCMVPVNSPWASSIASQEAANGVYTNASAGWIWVGNTSRDEYSGVMFGLAVAYDAVSDSGTLNAISDLVTRLVDFLNGNNWSVVMPNGSSVTSFLARPDQVETFLAIGRHINPGHFSSLSYEAQREFFAATVPAPILVDTSSDDSYFKFNLDYINLYNLIRLEASAEKSIYQEAYAQLRGYTKNDQNAFFNIIDLALNGADPARDNQTLALLDGWLLRLRRDFNVDLSNTVPVCGSQACTPAPVWLRPNTDFLWQRSPYELAVAGGAGIIETAAIDYILPYWMARYYGLQESIIVQSAAAPMAVVAPDSLGSIYGANLASIVQQAVSLPLGMSLGGVTVTVQDSQGTSASAALLYVSPGQINFLVPSGLATGVATFTITDGSRAPLSAIGAVGQVAPAIFSVDTTGSGVAAATAIRVDGANPASSSPVTVFNCGVAACQAAPIDVSTRSVYLTLYATGVRHRGSLDSDHVSVIINGIFVPVLYAGPQPDFAGLDQINVALPAELRGSGLTNVVAKVNQHQANLVTVAIQ
ncbi:MAG TPA: hypothetical protein VKB88_27555 [Bryobacteraceae bacterium]|nr:hypothetical protein [Bryobacteraceae bacterium]